MSKSDEKKMCSAKENDVALDKWGEFGGKFGIHMCGGSWRHKRRRCGDWERAGSKAVGKKPRGCGSGIVTELLVGCVAKDYGKLPYINT